MSRKNNPKSNKPPKSSKHSTLAQHRQIGKTLVPPLATIPNLTPAPWRDERMPEMLWAVLLISQTPRSAALHKFREIAECIHRFNASDLPFHELTLTGISRMGESEANEVISVLTTTEEAKRVLDPLLLFDDLPAKELWSKAIGLSSQENRWGRLKEAVGKTLDHQSQESTDCRWARLIGYIAGDMLRLPKGLFEEVTNYPDYGDMTKVRSLIRASEIALPLIKGEQKKDWSIMFWNQCLKDTDCIHFSITSEIQIPIIGTTPVRVNEVYADLLKHWRNNQTTTGIDPKMDAVFGMAIYCLILLQEMLRIGASQSISARLEIRTIVECYINLAYLAKKDDPELWKSYRVFGAGQAKLQYLKLENLDCTSSSFNLGTLQVLANEDMWEEYLPIDLGHWENSTLRNLSIEAGLKDVYDRYYTWTSSFTHGHWGSIREAVFDICINPIHRFHRIPSESIHCLPDVIPDACELVDKILDILSTAYPDFSSRVTIN